MSFLFYVFMFEYCFFKKRVKLKSMILYKIQMPEWQYSKNMAPKTIWKRLGNVLETFLKNLRIIDEEIL